MSTPLIDIDVNPRRPGFKPTKPPSKIPSPPKTQRAGNKGRRSPFSVSTTGSPCYTEMPPESKLIASPTSKLPRMSGQTQSDFSKSYTYGARPATLRTSLPRACNLQKPASITAPPSPVCLPTENKINKAKMEQNLSRTTPPLSCNKPLPSPPIAQIMDSASPLRAQRTLVDAEAGSPTEEIWPVLHPDNVTPSKPSTLSTDSKLLQRSVSEGSPFRRTGTPELRGHVATLPVSNRSPSQQSESSTQEEHMLHQRPDHMAESRALVSMDPYARSFHAFSTNNNNIVTGNPLARKQHALPVVAIPPRISSKRTPLPLLDITVEELLTEPAELIRPANPDCTKWPTLAAASAITEAEVTDRTPENDHAPHFESNLSVSESFDGADATHARYGLIDSASTWSLGAGSSLERDSEVNHEGAVRVKRLSWHSSDPESGPTLRIYADADAFIMGRCESAPAVPTLPEHMLRKPLQERSIGHLPGKFSEQVDVDTMPVAGLRISTPSSTELVVIENRPVKITPIRSMQPPRKPSMGDLSKKSPSLGTPSTGDLEAKETQNLPHAHSPGSFATSQASSVVQHSSDTMPSTSEVYPRNDYAAGNYSSTLQDEVPQSNDTGALKSANRKHRPMAWITPMSATFTMKKSGAVRSKTSPLIRSIERVSNRASAISTHLPSSGSSVVADSSPFQSSSRQLGSSRLGVTDLEAQDGHSILNNNSSKEIPTNKQVATDRIRRTGAKRSFRNVFRTRDPKATPLQSTEKQDSQDCSVGGRALTHRVRNSAKISKVGLKKPPEVKPEPKHDTVIFSGCVEAPYTENRPPALSGLEAMTSETVALPLSAAQYDTTTAIHSILDRVTSMGKESPDRLRGLEIAEAVLQAVECSKEAKVSAKLARKYARDAELNVECAGLGLRRLEKLCESGFDDETMQLIRHVIMAVDICVTNAASDD